MASKITIKRSLTAAAPAGLSFGEMAFVQGSGNTAEQLYVGISGGNPVWVGARVEDTVTDWTSKTRLATQAATVTKINSLITANTAGVASFNGLTGAVTGVSSFNGLTGAVSGVTTSVANTFTQLNTFSAGISTNGGTFGTPTQLVGTNITGTATAFTASNVTTNANLTGAITSVGNGTTLGSFTSAQLSQALTDNTGSGVAVFDTSPNFTTSLTTNSATLALFNSGFPTTLNGFGAATNMTLGATSGNAVIRNPILTLGNSSTSGSITTTNGNLIFVPGGPTIDDGDIASLTITNTESVGQVQIEGGDLFLGNKSDGTTTTPVNIIFEGASANNHEITLTVTDPTADRTITLPDATGTVALTQTSVASFNGVTGAVTGVSSFNGATGAVTGVSSFNGLTGAVSGLTSGGPLGTPASGILSSCTGYSINNLVTSPTTSILSVGTIELGDSTDTTLARSGAGVVTIEGVAVVTVSAAQTLTNKTLTGATLTSPSLGTPTLLVGTNITGTASSFTAGSVTTNANLTGAITSVGNGTTLGSFSSAHLRNALTDETGTGVAVFGTDPAITTSLTTPSTSFDLLNTTATTVNFAGGASSALNIGNVGGTATFAGSVIVNGNFTVQGNTTTLNTTTLNVEDFNITMGLTLTSDAQCTGAGIGIGVGTGITFAYDHSSLGWLSSVNMDLATGKVFKIANASVLSSSALGAGVTGSSLTQVGTITSGTWNSSFAAGIISNADINASAGIVDTKLATIATPGKVSNAATTATNLNTASAIVARDGSGNFTAGTITAALTGNASTATDATNATNIVVTSDSSDTTCFIPFVTDNGSGPQAVKVNYSLTYNAVSGELSTRLIDGGTF